MGALQFGLGALVSPLVGSSPLMMAIVMLSAATLALSVLVALTRRKPAAEVPSTNPTRVDTSTGR
jgi:DHA1 family bicyclomycin/chloramphenicol resistance-like MFS transporter